LKQRQVWREEERVSSLTILHVDATPDSQAIVAHAVARALPEAQVKAIASADELKEALGQPFDLVITELHLGWSDGLNVVERARERQPEAPVIIFTASDDEADVVRGLDAEVDGYVLKTARPAAALIAATRLALRAAATRGQAAAHEAALQRTLARQRVVAEAVRSFAADHDVASLADHLAQAAASAIGEVGAVHVFLEREPARAMLAIHHLEPDLADQLFHVIGPPSRPSSGVAERVLTTGEALVLNGAAEVFAHLGPEHRESAERLGLTAALAAPIRAGGRTFGVLSCWRSRPGSGYEEDDRVIAEELAAAAASVVAAREAEEALHNREQLLSVAIHEVQNPLAGIKGVAQLLLRLEESGRLTPDRLRQGLRSIEDSTDRLSRLVHDLLDATRGRLGQFTISLEPVELGDLIDRILRRYAAVGASLVRADDRPLSVHADPARLEQVFTNVLDNAVKFSPPGAPIAVRLEREGDGVLVTVTDQGIGLPRGAAEAIFDPYHRAANAAGAQIPGLGLGLFIARQIVEQHAGAITAESPGEGLGTTIRIWLPAASDPLLSDHPTSDHSAE
jgi:signal transduction histidine kinase